MNLERLKQQYAEAVPHCQACGMEVIRLERGRAHVDLPWRDAWLGDPGRGLMNTGIITTLIDSAAGLAVLAALETPERIATLDLRVDYLRAGRPNQTLRCEARTVRVTDHIIFVQASTWQDDPEALVATANASFMRGSSRQAVLA